MAKSLSIVANEATKRVLAQLGTPVVNVAVRGRVVRNGKNSTLLIEGVSTSKQTSLPIIASNAARKVLGDLAAGETSTAVNLTGRVAYNGSANVLVLDRVSKAMPLVADADTRELLAELAAEGEGEVTLSAKVGAGGILVLGSDKKSKKK